MLFRRARLLVRWVDGLGGNAASVRVRRGIARKVIFQSACEGMRCRSRILLRLPPESTLAGMLPPFRPSLRGLAFGGRIVRLQLLPLGDGSVGNGSPSKTVPRSVLGVLHRRRQHEEPAAEQNHGACVAGHRRTLYCVGCRQCQRCRLPGGEVRDADVAREQPVRAGTRALVLLGTSRVGLVSLSDDVLERPRRVRLRGHPAPVRRRGSSRSHRRSTRPPRSPGLDRRRAASESCGHRPAYSSSEPPVSPTTPVSCHPRARAPHHCVA